MPDTLKIEFDVDGIIERWPDATVSQVQQAIWRLTGRRAIFRFEHVPRDRRGWSPWVLLDEGGGGKTWMRSRFEGDRAVEWREVPV